MKVWFVCEAEPLTEITMQSVVELFVNTWIASHRVPHHVIIDMGSQFESDLFLELSKMAGIHRLWRTV